MTIEGLAAKTPHVSEAPRYQAGTPDVAEAVSVTVEAMSWLGIVEDEVKLASSLEADFTDVAELGYDGRLFVKPAAELASFQTLIDGAEGKRPQNFSPLFRYSNLWVPDTEADSYTEAELNRAPVLTLARLALFNASFNASETGADPVLHHLDKPFDDVYREEGERTQLEALDEDVEALETKHDGYDVQTINHRDFAILALMDRIRGVKPADQILSQGFMRIPALGRRTVDGGSCVGVVFSRGAYLYLSGSDGDALPAEGVGLSVGQKKLKP